MEEVDPLTGEVLRATKEAAFYPSSHYVTQADALDRAVHAIEAECDDRVGWFRRHKKVVEADRLARRVRYDLELMRETGFCPGIENYSSHLDGRAPGEPPWTLLDYFPDDFLLVVDESHVTVPQIGGMFEGDRRRKETLVEYGFRLPCALDNRPLRFAEFEVRVPRALYVSATPGPWEKAKAGGISAEQVIRPTGIVDPPVSVRPATAPGRRRAEGGPRAGGAQGAGPRHDADEAHGGGADRAPGGGRGQGPLAALRRDDARARRDPEGPPARRLRRARGDQPPARGPRPARGVARRRARRRPGGVPPLRDVADPDGGPGRAQRERAGDLLRRQGDRLDAAGARRDGAAPDRAGGLQRRARDHPVDASCARCATRWGPSTPIATTSTSRASTRRRPEAPRTRRRSCAGARRPRSRCARRRRACASRRPRSTATRCAASRRCCSRPATRPGPRRARPP